MVEKIIFLGGSFIVVYLLYLFVTILPNKKFDPNKKIPVEVDLLVRRYHLDLSKINYPRLLNCIAIVSSLDIAVTVFLIQFIKHFILQLICGIALIIPLILASYYFIGNHYVKKGMVKNV